MKVFSAVVLVAYFLSVVLVATAQNKDGVVNGTVMDSFGAVLPDVQIEAKSKAGKVFKTQTDADGNYRLKLPEGRYNLAFKRLPFSVFSISDYQMPFLGKMGLDVSLVCDKCPIVNSSITETH